MRNLAHLRGPARLPGLLGLVLGTAFVLAVPCFGDDSLRGGFTLRPLDGATIRAVEKHVNPNPHSLGLSIGLIPFDPYYLGLTGAGDYTYQYDETVGWEVLNGSYVFPVNKELQTRLADAGVTNLNLDRLNYLITTNVLYAFAYGKALLFKDFIRYFRASGIAGIGAAGSTLRTQFGLNLGVRFEFYAADGLSWRFEFRDLLTVSADSSSYSSFLLGVGIGL